MEHSSSVAFLLACTPFLGTAQSHHTAQNTELASGSGNALISVSTPVSFEHTTPAREWPVLDEQVEEARAKHEVRNDRAYRPEVNANALPIGMDPARQPPDGTWRSAIPTQANFAGNNSNGLPPDPSGAAGPDHYVQAVNTSYRVYSKTGSSVAGPFSLSSLWAGSSNEGDPIVMYDRHAQRWFISQFQFSPNRILIAVSETSDPTGSYYAYTFSVGQFPDYPKYSTWWDGYYMTSNSNQTAVVFERAKMLTGDPNAQMIILSAPSAGTAGFRSVLPADADGDLPPNGTPCYFFNLEDDSWGGVSQDRIRIYEMDVDWVNPSNTTISVSQTLNTTPFSTNFGSGFSNIAQPGTTQELDAVAQIFYYRAQHMRFVDHSSIMLCHVVDVNGQDQGGVRWYELRDNNDGNWSIHQQSTFSPDNASRWMASIAMDTEGNVGLAYSITDPALNVYPGLRFTGRYESDPLNTMTIEESIGINGTGSQTGLNRYGDYAHMSLDPNGTTFWFTGEYLSGTGTTQRTRVFSFDLLENVGIEEGDRPYAQAELSAYLNGDNLEIAMTGMTDRASLVLDIISMEGKVMMDKNVMVGTGWKETIDISTLAPGAYFVRVGNAEFQRVERIVRVR